MKHTNKAKKNTLSNVPFGDIGLESAKTNAILIPYLSERDHVLLVEQKRSTKKKVDPLANEKKTQESFLNFLDGMSSKCTRDAYTRAVDRFLSFADLKDYDEATSLSQVDVSSKVKSFIRHLKEPKNKENNFKGLDLATNTVKTNLAGVMLFFTMNDILLNGKKLYKMVSPNDPDDKKKKSIIAGGKPYTNDDIKRLLGATKKLRTKALIHFFVSTGARPAVLWDPYLRMKHLSEMPNDCLAVHLYSDSNEAYYAFLTPEASQALKDYHKERKIAGEIFTDETPLFVVRGGKPMDEASVRSCMKTTVKLAGIEKHKVNNKTDKPVFYGFRKRFNTILKRNNNVNSNIAEKLMGHKNGLDGTYLTPNPQECFAEFYKAVSELMIDQTEVQKNKIVELQHTKDYEISMLKEQIATLKEIVNDLQIPKDEMAEWLSKMPKLRATREN